ncbi:FtsK/SpoIIIE domain-containing protein [Actinomycetospora aeridis]|uniref:FtsK/SpoIIIE domain-containing protein n=1 Tax=Actinomycetospora aeridis TaxID=3129231 RepID=A0ABU8NBC5_9PSEU
MPIGRSVGRGATIRRRANVQPTLIEPSRTFAGRLRHRGLVAAGRFVVVAVWGAIMAGWLLLYVPVLLAAAALVALVWTTQGRGGGLALIALVTVALVVWSPAHPDSWERCVASRCHRFARRIRYRWNWADLMAAAEVQSRDAHHIVRVPRLLYCRLGRYADLLTVQLCPGITPEDLEAATEAIRSEFRALEVRVLPHERFRGCVWLRVICSDTLLDPTAPPKGPDADRPPDLTKLHLGRREDGEPWLLRLLGRHLLVAGATGAGKSSVVASLLVQLAPAIHAGTVRLIGIDPKGGMEFGLYRDLFHLLACETEEDMVRALEAAAELVADRARSMAGVTRQHEPTVEEPFYVVLVDEIASLTAYIGDRGLKERAKQALGRLLTKGRAPGVSVVGCVQDPRKDVLEVRNLFTTRIGLRLAEKTEVPMVLGEGARERGALCDRIPMSAPGVGYLVEDGSTVVTKVRAAYVDDDQLRWLAQTFPCPTLEVLPEVVDLPDQQRRPRKSKSEREAS